MAFAFPPTLSAIVLTTRRRKRKLNPTKTLFSEIVSSKKIPTYNYGKPNFTCSYNSGEQGANEKTNGATRQYFPKGMDFRKLADEMLWQDQMET